MPESCVMMEGAGVWCHCRRFGRVGVFAGVFQWCSYGGETHAKSCVKVERFGKVPESLLV